ncbi:hypothetical protein RR46_07062 [Papilio xuthus]|uniref:Uncharacterized protein n=1 Tax=Papilio xuthus TaxID=66420 RepID=A0A194Q4K2_PAPXU|nr:hypothetical protein RR46_07062 [Papilio xuthus]
MKGVHRQQLGIDPGIQTQFQALTTDREAVTKARPAGKTMIPKRPARSSGPKWSAERPKREGWGSSWAPCCALSTRRGAASPQVNKRP